MNQPIKRVKVMITGGHHTPAMALMESLKDELSKAGIAASFYWVGHRYSMRGDKNESLEYKEVVSLGIPFFELRTPKFYSHSVTSSLVKLIFGTCQSFLILLKVRPNLVVSFGGYLCVPVIFAARVLGIKSVTHEQTTAAGFANRAVARFCIKVFISFSSSKKYFSPAKTILTGNPLRSEIFTDGGYFKFTNNKPVIYVTGGKQGAHKINLLVRESLPVLLQSYNVIHQSGSVSLHNDYEELLNFSQNDLPEKFRESYILKTHFGFSEIGSIFARVNYVVSRAGANIVCELAGLRKPAVLIPLPGSSHREQEDNAHLLKEVGLAEILEESNSNTESLVKSLENLTVMGINEQKLLAEFPQGASAKLAREIVKILW